MVKTEDELKLELLEAELESIELKTKAFKEKLEVVQSSDPFWHWEPNDGVITKERRDILRHWLKEEDIPDRTDSQLDVLLCDSEVRGVSGGNRSSKTNVGTIGGIIRSTGELPDSLKEHEGRFEHIIRRAKNTFIYGRVTGVDNKQLHRVILPEWEKYIPRKYLKGGTWEGSYSREFDILTLYREKKKCATVEFLTNAQEVKSAQGGNLHWANFDEEPERAKYKETLMRFGTSDRLDIEIDWTPTEGLTWATDLFHSDVFEEEEDTKDKTLFKLTSVTNPYVNTETLIKIMDAFAKVSSYEEMKMRLLGEAISLTGLIYSGIFNRSVHVIEPFPITKEHLVLRGLDPHTAKSTYCVEVAVDRMLNEYACGLYCRQADTEVIKQDLADRAIERGYRLGWTQIDRSSDSDMKVFGRNESGYFRNIFKELTMGKNYIPAAAKSDKYTGSIHAGVDEIKKLLRADPPRFYIFNTPEMQPLIKAFQTLEREAYANEDKKGLKDRINEGKHDAHAALRYIHQRRVIWMPTVEPMVQYETEENYV